MRNRGYVIGIVCGLLLGGLVALLSPPRHAPGVSAQPLGEDGGRITRVVMQYSSDAGEMVASIYRQFLSALGSDVEVIWVAGSTAEQADLKARLGSSWPSHARSVIIGKPITTWAKDRCVAMRTPEGPSVLCAPARTRTASLLRTNDSVTPYCLAKELPDLFTVQGMEADFDGGDVMATTRHLLMSPAVMEKNSPRFSAGELTKYLAAKMSEKITWLSEELQHAPAHHIGMYLTVIGKTAAVGDVRLAESVAGPETALALRTAGGAASPSFRADLQTRLDYIARRMRTLGYTVVRVPLLPSATPRAWMSYNNGIVDTRDGKAIYYMPTFGSTTLDNAAAEAFRIQTGCTVIPIDCSQIWHLGGSLHCLVNVVGRSD